MTKLAIGRFTAAAILIAGLAAFAATALSGESQTPTWPLATVPQDLIENGGTTLGPTTAKDAAAAAGTRSVAERLAVDRNPGAIVREVVLVELSSTGAGASRETGSLGVDRRLVWAVSIVPKEGVRCRGCTAGMRDQAIIRLRGKAVEPGSLTEEEWTIVNADVDRQLEDYLAKVRDVYHIEFVDALTGEWVGGAAGFRGPQ